MRARVRFVTACAVIVAAGCGVGRTQIVIETDTDYEVGVELSRVEWEVRYTSRGSGEQLLNPTPTIDVGAADVAAFPLRLTLLPPEGDTAAALTVTARGYAPDGSLLVEQVKRTHFVPERSAVLRFDLSRLCAELTCDDTETCLPDGPSAACASHDSPPLPLFDVGLPHGQVELCNGRDDDGDSEPDNDFEFDEDVRHCGGCFAACPDADFSRPICVDGVCGLECDQARADCDAVPGCEARLDEPRTCGDCALSCVDPTPLCGPDGEGFACARECAVDLTACDGTCVVLATHLSHCGSCGHACPDPPGPGRAACVDGSCEPICDSGAHACGELCQPDDSINSCGTRCDPCPPAGPNATDIACVDGQCEQVCEEGFLDCDGEATAGCEVELAGSDARNCGGCGIDCGYGSCAAGQCSNRVMSYALGPRHTCVALADRRYYCWGANESGQLGIGTLTRSEPTPREAISVPRPPAPGFVSGSSGSIAALDDQTSYFLTTTWVSLGALGGFIMKRVLGVGLDPREPAATAPVLTVPFAQDFIGPTAEVAVRNGSGFFLRAPELWGWGSQRGEAFSTWDDPHDVDETITPTNLFTPAIGLSAPGARIIARGLRVTCMHTEPTAGVPRLVCWGTDDTGPAYIGNGATAGSASPRLVWVGAGGRFAPASGRFDVGFEAACAPFRISGGTARYWCWGSWECGGFSEAPAELGGPFNADAIDGLTVGESAACGVTVFGTEGRLLCWGRDLLGGACEPSPTRRFTEYADIASVQLSRDHGCFVRAPSGTIWCWGDNDSGQLGTDAGPGTHGPQQVVFTTPPSP